MMPILSQHFDTPLRLRYLLRILTILQRPCDMITSRWKGEFNSRLPDGMGVAKGRYENVGMKQLPAKLPSPRTEQQSLSLDIAKHRDAVEMSKTADDIPLVIYALCLYPAGYSAHRGHPYCGRARLYGVVLQFVVCGDDLIHI